MKDIRLIILLLKYCDIICVRISVKALFSPCPGEVEYLFLKSASVGNWKQLAFYSFSFLVTFVNFLGKGKYAESNVSVYRHIQVFRYSLSLSRNCSCVSVLLARCRHPFFFFFFNAGILLTFTWISKVSLGISSIKCLIATKLLPS